MVILVTGGAGFIGSHTCLELLRRGYRVVVADDYSNSSPTALAAVREVSGLDLTAYEMDVRDQTALDQVFTEHHVDAVIHFAARKSVREHWRSVRIRRPVTCWFSPEADQGCLPAFLA